MRWLKMLWVLPVAVPIWLCYLLPFWGLGLISVIYACGGVVHFRMVPKYSWWVRLWDGWAGHAMPFAIVTAPAPMLATVRHEFRHIEQWLVLGFLFPVVYLVLLGIYGYRNHPLERDARAHERKRG